MATQEFVPGDQDDGEYAICPYCGTKHGDCWEWVTGTEEDSECSGCGRTFLVVVDYDVTYSTRAKPAPSSNPSNKDGTR